VKMASPSACWMMCVGIFLYTTVELFRTPASTGSSSVLSIVPFSPRCVKVYRIRAHLSHSLSSDVGLIWTDGWACQLVDSLVFIFFLL
jgi:hypothetical protein